VQVKLGITRLGLVAEEKEVKEELTLVMIGGEKHLGEGNTCRKPALGYLP